MPICGGQRDAPRDTIPRTNFERDAGPSTALAGYVPSGSPKCTLARRRPTTNPMAASGQQNVTNARSGQTPNSRNAPNANTIPTARPINTGAKMIMNALTSQWRFRAGDLVVGLLYSSGVGMDYHGHITTIISRTAQHITLMLA